MLLGSITLIIFSLCLSLIICNTPLSIALWVVILALSSSTIVRLYVSSWFGIIIFLIYVGGILVMFAYFLAIQPNQQMGLGAPLLIFITTITLRTIDRASSTTPPLSTPYWLSSLIAPTNLAIMIALALTLFLALLMVVKIVSLEEGPLRPYNYV